MARRNKFLIIVSLIFFLTFFYLGIQLVFRTQLPFLMKAVLSLSLIVPFLFVIWLPAVHWNKEGPESGLDHAMQWAAYYSMGLLSFLLFFTALRDVVCIPLILLVHLGWPVYGLDGTVVVFGSALIALIIGTVSARKNPRIERRDIFLSGLPSEFEGFKIAQISDLHIGFAIKTAFVETVVQMVNALDADIVVLTGDIGDGEAKLLRDSIRPLGDLKSQSGTFYVTGNHEYYWGADDWVEEIRSLRITPLIGSHFIIEKNRARLMLAGVPDPTVGNFKPGVVSDPQAVMTAAPAADVRILLSHQPQMAQKAADAGFDLQISGHTHGGQFIPWTYVVRFFHPFVAGLGRCGKMWIYVNRGTGFWGPPVRLGSRSEITLLRLRAL